MSYEPLDCGLYDLVELFCMHRYELCVETVDGELIYARAWTTKTAPTHEEYLQLVSSRGIQEVRLDMIAAITVLTGGTGFVRTRFGSSSCPS